MLERLKRFFSNGPGAFIAACAVTLAAYGLGSLLRPFADLLTDIICAATLLGLIILLRGNILAWLRRHKPSRLVVR